MSHTLTETWLPVVGYEGKYEVSDQGNVRSWLRANGLGDSTASPRPMKTVSNYAGYQVISLSKDGIKKQHRVHCLVLAAFVGPRPAGGYHGAHHDDDKSNNALSNLAWKSVNDNIVDRSINGRTATGRRHGSYKEGKFVGNSRKYYPPKNLDRLPA